MCLIYYQIVMIPCVCEKVRVFYPTDGKRHKYIKGTLFTCQKHMVQVKWVFFVTDARSLEMPSKHLPLNVLKALLRP